MANSRKGTPTPRAPSNGGIDVQAKAEQQLKQQTDKRLVADRLEALKKERGITLLSEADREKMSEASSKKQNALMLRAAMTSGAVVTGVAETLKDVASGGGAGALIKGAGKVVAQLTGTLGTMVGGAVGGVLGDVVGGVVGFGAALVSAGLDSKERDRQLEISAEAYASALGASGEAQEKSVKDFVKESYYLEKSLGDAATGITKATLDYAKAHAMDVDSAKDFSKQFQMAAQAHNLGAEGAKLLFQKYTEARDKLTNTPGMNGRMNARDVLGMFQNSELARKTVSQKALQDPHTMALAQEVAAKNAKTPGRTGELKDVRIEDILALQVTKGEVGKNGTIDAAGLDKLNASFIEMASKEKLIENPETLMDTLQEKTNKLLIELGKAAQPAIQALVSTLPSLAANVSAITKYLVVADVSGNVQEIINDLTPGSAGAIATYGGNEVEDATNAALSHLNRTIEAIPVPSQGGQEQKKQSLLVNTKNDWQVTVNTTDKNATVDVAPPTQTSQNVENQ